MSKRSTVHATFTIERNYDAPPSRVFAAWSDPVAKARWFIGPDDWQPETRELDFRVGGREILSGGVKGSPKHVYEARYWDIVPNERIVSTYDMHIGTERISVSLATVEFKPAGKGTRLVYTEQGAFLDGYDDAGGRERGTRELLDRLETALHHQGAH